MLAGEIRHLATKVGNYVVDMKSKVPSQINTLLVDWIS